VIAAKYFYGNQTTALLYLRNHQGFDIPNKSNFNQMVHRLSEVMLFIFSYLGNIFKHLNLESTYLVDSFPVSVCRNIRISSANIVQGEAFRGYNVAKREYVFGFKVHVITTAEGAPVEFLVTTAEVHDVAAFREMELNLPQGSDL